MKKHLFVKTILIGLLGIWITQPGQGQNLDQLATMKPSSFFKEGVKITGNIVANHLFYSASGIDDRRTPFNFFYTGNLNVNLFGKINMPVTFSYSNQNVTFSQPFSQANPFTQPFNRLVLRPTYKGLTLHLGTCALTFSPYTVSGYRYKGVGMEYKSPKQPVYFSLLYGTLQPAVLVDTSYQYQNNRPSYKRIGMGIKLGYKHQQDVAE
ncbi:hypothetical protein [Spirosoma foliorum]|uniref:Uncharacterized protein n=1 Tax=Spirosoma foliorum TaxID=2710596 RepID=A0A7G5GWS5_9BACT|nr:hypothetical protein [Spirosoma foliorum]QMW03317.1 hypothetical protein H3H32_36610 [Spirosoma foliorum]